MPARRHPDDHGRDERAHAPPPAAAVGPFKDLNDAHQVLEDPEQRADTDSARSAYARLAQAFAGYDARAEAAAGSRPGAGAASG